MSDIGKAYVQIVPKAQGISKAIESELGGGASQAGESIGGKFTSGFKSVIGKLGVAAAAGAATKAVSDLAKQSIDAYANFEQLEGGIKTLFGKDAQTVMDSANAAFMSAGMSANDYMETSIQSAAAMISSLKGNTAEAAKLMDMSIVDMSDNVNKMGTSMQSVQDAYRGFSRGNFTMLDNLALGFAGTKEGMQELLDQAQSISGVEYNIDSYADIVQAIHTIQEEMGVAGTTMEEGVDTISGSINTMKSAWENLVAGFGKEGADIGGLIDNVVTAGESVLKNIMPILENVLAGMGDFIAKAVPIILEKLPDVIVSVIPSLLGSVSQLLTSVASELPGIISGLLLAITDPQFMVGLVQAGIGLVTGLVNGLMQALPTLIEALPTIIENIVTFFTTATPMLIESIFTVLIPSIISNLPTIIATIVQALIESTPLLISGIGQIFVSVVGAIVSGIGSLASLLGQLIMGIITSIGTWLSQLPEKVAYWIGATIGAAVGFLVSLPARLQAFLSSLFAQIKQFFAELPRNIVEKVKEIIEKIKSVFKNLPTVMKQIGKSIVDGIKKGIMEKWNSLKSWFGSLGKGLGDGFKKSLKINSPSKVFEEYGMFLDEGLAIGLEGGVKKINDSMDSVNSAVYSNRISTLQASRMNADGGEFEEIGNGTIEPTRSGMQQTVILELDKVQLGKVVYNLNNAESQRMGVSLVNA